MTLPLQFLQYAGLTRLTVGTLLQVLDLAAKRNLRLVVALANNWDQDSNADNKLVHISDACHDVAGSISVVPGIAAMCAEELRLL